jgi:DnaJ-class molecular chaperone
MTTEPAPSQVRTVTATAWVGRVRTVAPDTAQIPVVCPTCDGTGHGSVGTLPAGGYCPSCRGTGEVTPTTRERLERLAAVRRGT